MSSDDDDDKKDLTAIADIAEFLHELDPEVDKQLEHGEDATAEKAIEEPEEDFPQEFQVDKPEEEEKEKEEEKEEEADFGESMPTEEFEGDLEATPEEEDMAFPTEEEETSEEEFSMEAPETEVFETEEEETVAMAEPDFPQEVEEEEEIEEEVEEEEEEEEFEPTREESQVLEKPTPAPPPPQAPPPSEGGMAEVSDFAKNIPVGQASVPGNPPFSVVLKNIKYSEDAQDILRILKEYGVANDSNESVFKQGLDAGSLLISQISEYTAIILTHKFRQFDLEIMMGLSDEIHPPKLKEGKGLVSKISLDQNKVEHLDLKTGVESPEIILLATTPTLENYKINRYIGIITEQTKVSEEGVKDLQDNFDQNFGDLTDKLKDKAFKLRGNAVVGITYQMTPLVPIGEKGYTLTCSGNVVWVSLIES